MLGGGGTSKRGEKPSVVLWRGVMMATIEAENNQKILREEYIALIWRDNFGILYLLRVATIPCPHFVLRQMVYL